MNAESVLTLNLNLGARVTSSPHLKAGFWVKAHIRRCYSLGIPAFVRHSGDPDHGSVLLKIDRRAAGAEVSAEVLAPVSSLDGARVWLRLTGKTPVSDTQAEALIARRLAHEPDLWVLEIEDAGDLHQLDEPVRDA